jgi:hypothetical protein
VAAVQVKVDVAVEPEVRVTEATGWHERPVEGLAASVTVPAKPATDVTVTVDEPELVARMLAGETAPSEIV